jgi:hypothetical protein
MRKYRQIMQEFWNSIERIDLGIKGIKEGEKFQAKVIGNIIK